MKTVLLTPADEVELKLLRDSLARQADNEHRHIEARHSRDFIGGRYSDAERDARKAIEVINRLLEAEEPTLDRLIQRLASRGLLPCEHNLQIWQHVDVSGWGAAVETPYRAYQAEAHGETIEAALEALMRATNRSADIVESKEVQS